MAQTAPNPVTTALKPGPRSRISVAMPNPISGTQEVSERIPNDSLLCQLGRRIWANSEQMSFAVEALASSPELRAADGRGLRQLSKREVDVVRSLAEGLTNREIAERLGLSQHTIKNYLFRGMTHWGYPTASNFFS